MGTEGATPLFSVYKDVHVLWVSSDVALISPKFFSAPLSEFSESTPGKNSFLLNRQTKIHFFYSGNSLFICSD